MKNLTTLFAVFTLIIISPFIAQAGPVGKFTNVEGRVDITRPDKAAVPVKVGDEIYEKDIIRTKSKSKAEIVFFNGNSLRLAQSTRVEISECITGEQRNSSVLRLFRGKIQSKVKKLAGRVFGMNRDRYEVHTPTAVCGVRGTDFFTFYRNGVTGNIFKEGIGYGYSKNKPDEVREILPGQTMLVTSPDQPPLVRPTTEEELIQHEGDTAPSKKEEEGDDEEQTEDEQKDEQKEVKEDSSEQGEEDQAVAEDEGEQQVEADEEDQGNGGNETESVDAGAGVKAGKEIDADPPGNVVSGDSPSEDNDLGGYNVGNYGSDDTMAIDNLKPADPGIENAPPVKTDMGNTASLFENNPLYIPPSIPTTEPFKIDSIKISGDLIAGPYIYYEDGKEESIYNYYQMDMSGTFSMTPPFLHINAGVRGNILTGTGPLSGAYYLGFVGADWSDLRYERVRGVAVMFYVAPDGSGGILDGDIFGDYLSSGTWQAKGYMVPIEMVDSGLPFDFPPITNKQLFLNEAAGFFEAPGDGTISVDWGHGQMLSITDQDWGLWRSEFGGSFTNNIYDKWVIEWKDSSPTPSDAVQRYYYTLGKFWKRGEMDGDVSGGWVDLEKVTTGIFEGGMHGVYNPNDPAGNYFAVSGGAWIETNKFLEMVSTSQGQERLNALYIPCIEVGRADLSLSGSDTVFNAVNMNNVIFFANSTGGAPRIWATNEVDGTYSSIPSVGHAVNLTGNGLSVDFTVKKWNDSVWSADVKGSGVYSGSGTLNNTDIRMDGGAAGTYSGSDFSGTAAGASRVLPPP